ncbi:D-lactonohydrolase-like protein [Guyanagaster necrorhizus]|uniref:D-lactonohydrolase-like protein n=1 Tax=Guyanagaster necrorhizus TaxID=856835 RepID=A0A9P7VH33_9AGAR|nr:D-lactonohydrolase-like protein [Guyanagaster necrorhizus MCA 3950]KAG7440453.1 D-lactonohydrolase-like protein [Guyanagaster necrorhizus MCA 3950]
MPFMPYLVVALVALVAFAWAKIFPGGTQELRLPPQSVLVDPRSVATLGANASFRENAFDSHFNPTNTTPPFFQVFDRSFLAILGSSPSIHEVASNDTFAFAHEAPIYDPSSDDVFFASNNGGPLGMSNLEHNSQISKLSLSAAEAANGSLVSITPLDLPNTIQMTNGGTGPYKSSLLLITSGRGPLPPSIALVNPHPPHNVTVLLDNYFGRQFNSLNDIKVHPSGKIFFTDVTYGFLLHFRSTPQMPNQVYRFDPNTGSVRVVADGFDKCNGLAFSGDGRRAYIADTGAAGGYFGNNQTEPATIYAFDVNPKTHAFMNRRVFAYVDSGVPDGIQVDTDGNVYSGCGDGVQVWNNEGTLIGKFFLGMTSANMVFAGNGRLIILAETKVFLAKIAAKGVRLGGP